MAKIIVFGATGGTGKLVVEQALLAGHRVTVIVRNPGPFTFFAPSDLAFEKLEKGFMEALLVPENKVKLTDLLNSHIVNGKVHFKELKDGDRLETLNGNQLMVEVKNGKVTIGDAVILGREAKITNGVMHSTDTVFRKD